jgi:hypothetical protein
MQNASGFLLRLHDRLYVGTAWHVVGTWLGRRDSGEAPTFQVGSVELNPTECLGWSDETADIAFLHMAPDRQQLIEASICEPQPDWPPPPLVPNNDVIVSGFPEALRISVGREVDARSLQAHLVVEDVNRSVAVCRHAADGYPTDRNGELVPLERKNLSGWSGSPCFLVGHLAYPLVAIVKEHAFDHVFLSMLSGVDGLGGGLPGS